MSRVDLRREPWLRASARRLAGSKEAHPARLTTTFEPPTVDHDVRPPITANLPAVSPRCPLTFKMRAALRRSPAGPSSRAGRSGGSVRLVSRIAAHSPAWVREACRQGGWSRSGLESEALRSPRTPADGPARVPVRREAISARESRPLASEGGNNQLM